MKLNTLLREWVTLDSSQDIEISGISLDSRTIQKGDLFIALADVEHIAKAVEKGAVAVLVDKSQNLSGLEDLTGLKSIVFVALENLKDKLAELAARFYHFPAQKLDIIGITGTNGKTSCSQFLAQVLPDAMIIGTLGWGTFGHLTFTGYTTPDAVQLQKILAESVAQQKKNVVMEVSSHGVQEKRIEQTLFKGAVFTNLSRDHLDYHGSMEEYFNAKLQLFKRPELQFAVINADDEYGQRIIAALNPDVALWAFSKNLPGFENLEGLNVHHVLAQNTVCSPAGIEFDVSYNGETAHIKSQLYGEFNIENVLAVLTTLLAIDLSLSEAALKVSQLKPVIGRLEYFGGNQKPAIFVDYAHTPDALEKLLLSIKQHKPHKIHLVFGCGGNRDKGKRPLMGAIAEKLADNIIVTDDNPRFEEGDAIIAEILNGFQNANKAVVIRDRAKAIQTAILQAGQNDCVIIAGKGHEDYQEIKAVKNSFSDQAVVEQALEIREKS